MGRLMAWLRYLDRVIRGEAMRPDAIQRGEIEQPIGGLTIVGAFLGVFYGMCMACYALFQRGGASLPQMLATMLKVPTLFFLTLAVTFPSLYVFNALVGSRLSAQSVLRLLVIALSVMLTVLASLGPIVAFFSASTTNYFFMLLLNVVVFTVSGLLGLRYLRAALQRLSDALAPIPVVPPLPAAPSENSDPDGVAAPIPPEATPTRHSVVSQPLRSEVKTVFRIWMLVFGLVGAQMAWVLRPFLGSPQHAFTWFRGRESNFFEAMLYTIRHLF